MLRLRAFRPTQDKVVKLLLHPTYPWLVTADGSDNVVVWDWEHRQVRLCLAPLFFLAFARSSCFVMI
jgi:hypothetical protein